MRTFTFYIHRCWMLSLVRSIGCIYRKPCPSQIFYSSFYLLPWLSCNCWLCIHGLQFFFLHKKNSKFIFRGGLDVTLSNTIKYYPQSDLPVVVFIAFLSVNIKFRIQFKFIRGIYSPSFPKLVSFKICVSIACDFFYLLQWWWI